MVRFQAIADRVAAALPALVVALAAAFALRRLDNTDTWWHLAAGRWIAEHGTVPGTDTLSWTVPDHPWTDLQWLFEVGIHALYRAGGPTLLVVTAATAYALATALLLVNLRRVLGGLGAAVIGVWVVAVAQERFAIRPEMVSFLLLEVVLWLCATGRRPDRRRLWLLPLVMLVWVNSHALFIVGAFVIVCYVAGSFSRRMLVAGLAALLATMLNPYGPGGAFFPLKLMSRINGSNPVFQSIGEFRRPFSAYLVTFSVTAYQLLFVLGVVVTLAAAALSLRTAGGAVVRPPRARAERRRGGKAPVAMHPTVAPPRPNESHVPFDVAGLGVFVGLALLSLLARRNMALFAFGAAPFIGGCVAVLRARLPEGVRARADAGAGVLALAMPAALVAAGWFVVTNGFYRWNSELHEFGTGVLSVSFPIRASGLARELGLPQPQFNDLTSGGYLAWDRPLDTGTYIDGRLEVYDVDFFSHYLATLGDPARWQVDADRAGIQTVILFHWWPNHRPLVRHLAGDQRWALLYFDEVALVFVRRAGNEELVARAETRSRALREQVAAELLAPVSAWQWPIARVRGLSTYAAVLDLMSRHGEAIPFYSRLTQLSAGLGR